MYGRSAKGNRIYDTRPYERGTNLTLIGAISLSGFSGIITIDSGTSQNVFRVFIELVLLPNLSPGVCLVMDNLPAHKVQEIRNIVISNKDGKLFLHQTRVIARNTYLNLNYNDYIIEEAPNRSNLSCSLFS
ncbi:MAG: transposase [Trichodesmium sp. St18_bin1]|nr:transposase [Trichodesmium sp. St18_bin1]